MRNGGKHAATSPDAPCATIGRRDLTSRRLGAATSVAEFPAPRLAARAHKPIAQHPNNARCRLPRPAVFLVSNAAPYYDRPIALAEAQNRVDRRFQIGLGKAGILPSRPIDDGYSLRCCTAVGRRLRGPLRPLAAVPARRRCCRPKVRTHPSPRLQPPFRSKPARVRGSKAHEVSPGHAFSRRGYSVGATEACSVSEVRRASFPEVGRTGALFRFNAGWGNSMLLLLNRRLSGLAEDAPPPRACPGESRRPASSSIAAIRAGYKVGRRGRGFGVRATPGLLAPRAPSAAEEATATCRAAVGFGRILRARMPGSSALWQEKRSRSIATSLGRIALARA